MYSQDAPLGGHKYLWERPSLTGSYGSRNAVPSLSGKRRHRMGGRMGELGNDDVPLRKSFLGVKPPSSLPQSITGLTHRVTAKEKSSSWAHFVCHYTIMTRHHQELSQSSQSDIPEEQSPTKAPAACSQKGEIRLESRHTPAGANQSFPPPKIPSLQRSADVSVPCPPHPQASPVPTTVSALSDPTGAGCSSESLNISEPEGPTKIKEPNPITLLLSFPHPYINPTYFHKPD